MKVVSDNTKMGEIASSSLETNNKIPSVSEFMLSDDEYTKFLLAGHGKGSRRLGGNNIRYNNNDRNDVFNYDYADSQGRYAAKFCTVFSFIGMTFLIFAGYLIEVQPLYVKGVSPKRTIQNYQSSDYQGDQYNDHNDHNYSDRIYYVYQIDDDDLYYFAQPITDDDQNKRQRLLHNNNNNIYVHSTNHHHRYNATTPTFSRSRPRSSSFRRYIQRLLSGFTYRDQTYNVRIANYTQHNKRTLEEYEMKQEAKTSFKAASLYFLTMILSIIYTQSPDRVILTLQIFCRNVKDLLQIKTHFINLYYRKFRQHKQYNHIPEYNMPIRSNNNVHEDQTETIRTNFKNRWFSQDKNSDIIHTDHDDDEDDYDNMYNTSPKTSTSPIQQVSNSTSTTINRMNTSSSYTNIPKLLDYNKNKSNTSRKMAPFGFMGGIGFKKTKKKL